jgi:hypothetical protein
MISVPFQTKLNTWYALKAVAKGKQLEFYIDGKLVAEGKNNEFPAGKAGFVVQTMGVQPVEALYDDFVMTGPEVKDGGHWNPKAHGQAVELQSKLATTWGEIKRR